VTATLQRCTDDAANGSAASRSTDFLDLEVLPPRILFVGGGFISFEFAHISARAGSAPVIIDRQAVRCAVDPTRQSDPGFRVGEDVDAVHEDAR